MNHVASATTVASSSGGTGHTIITIIVLMIIGLAFPLAKRWADKQDERGGILSLRPEWVLRRGRDVIERFDDESEAARELTRRITTRATS